MKYDLTHLAMVDAAGIPVFLIPSATPDDEINSKRKTERALIVRAANEYMGLIDENAGLISENAVKSAVINHLGTQRDELLSAVKLAEATLLRIRASKDEMPYKIDAIAVIGKAIAGAIALR